jgi:type IV fimbrial biogenesis protein FimT
MFYARYYPPKIKTSGFSFVELMVVIAVIGIVLSIAAPSFNQFIERKRVEGLASVLSTDIQIAKSEAIKRNQNVTLSFTNGSSWSYLLASSGTTIQSNAVANHNGTSLIAAFNGGTVLTITPRLGSPTPAPANGDGITVSGNNSSLTITIKPNRSGQYLWKFWGV